MAENKQARSILVIRVPIEIVSHSTERDRLQEHLKQLSEDLSADYYTIFLSDNSVTRVEFEVHNTSATDVEIEELKSRLLESFEKAINA